MEPLNKVDPQSLPKLVVPLHMPTWQLGSVDLQLDGIVFTSLFNPYDGRKNRMDMLTAFCAAFRDRPDATLVFKLGHTNYQSAMEDMMVCMARMPPFTCRVVLLQGYLEDADFEALIRATSFIVNASYGEGQCLPLMEFLSCGKPAVAPCHSGMRDYIDEDVAFVVNSWSDAAPWAHDPRLAFRTLRHQIDWGSLVDAYQSAYRCVKDDPDRYAAMSRNAIERMRTYCSRGVATEKLQQFLKSRTVRNAVV
jgi:glycosyltransferase involved in cell wall biosynthesis